MNDLISSYGINFSEFQRVLRSLNGTVAGSAALAAYLKQEGIDPGFEPNDLDIFIPGYWQSYWNEEQQFTRRIKSYNTMSGFLASYGYEENNKFSSTEKNTGYYGSLNRIIKVTSFNNASGKEIQIIIIDSRKIIDYIKYDFDLSGCISWYCTVTNCFRTLDPERTKRKEMYIAHKNPTEEDKAKTIIRIQKYTARGFKIIPKPCPYKATYDCRTELSDKKFDGIDTIDIFTLDEMPIKDFLAKSDWNIILKAGEQHYAFERKSLYDYMNKKNTYIGHPVGYVYETPFNQCITEDALYHLKYSDFSIYELIPAYSTTGGGKVKSLFHLNCYSIKDWVAEPKVISYSLKMLNKLPVIPKPKPVGAAAILETVMLNSIAEMINAEVDEMINAEVDEIVAAHSHLLQPTNLEAFYAAVQEINGTE